MNLALFDLDNTLLAGDSDHAWGQFLCDEGIVDRAESEARNDVFYAQYKNGTLNIQEFLGFCLAPLATLPRIKLEALHQRFLHERVLPMIAPGAQALLDEHRHNGDLLAIVTATNAFVTAPIARALHVPHLIATVPAQENGRFTGAPRGTPAFREGKIERVETWLESMALNWQSFAKSYFYSDSLNDLPLLECVSHPIAVDPDPTLQQEAHARGWSIISLR